MVLLAVRLRMQSVRHVSVLDRPREDVGGDEDAAHEVVEGGGGAGIDLGTVEGGRLLSGKKKREAER